MSDKSIESVLWSNNIFTFSNFYNYLLCHQLMYFLCIFMCIFYTSLMYLLSHFMCICFYVVFLEVVSDCFLSCQVHLDKKWFCDDIKLRNMLRKTQIQIVIEYYYYLEKMVYSGITRFKILQPIFIIIHTYSLLSTESNL